jgi:hypothetical protein
MDTTTDKNKEILTLDLSDATNGALSGYAGRIGKLLAVPALHADPNLAGALDDFLGVVYSLIQAKQHQFSNRTGPIDITAVEKRAQNIAVGKVRTDGKWIAGVYFNNALFRTAAVQHRVLKVITKKNTGWVPELQKEAKSQFPQWASANLDLVHSEVNDLKHTPRGVHDQRTVTYAAAVNAVGELLDLIEAWAAANVPPKPKSP